jgi:Fe-S-cluster containining protein
VNPAVRQAYADFDVEASRLLRQVRSEGKSVPCKKGCSACCWDVAWVVQPEAEELVERIRSMKRTVRDGVIGRLRAWLEGMRAAGLDPDDIWPDLPTYHRARLRCPLLGDDGLCMAYDVRPMSCRGHYVIAPSSAVCSNRAVEPVIDTVEFPLAVAQAVMTMKFKPGDVDGLLSRVVGKMLGVDDA